LSIIDIKMENIIVKDKEYIILSSLVTNATRCVVTDIKDDKFFAEIRTDEEYKDGETVTMFTTAGSGVIHFDSETVSVCGRLLELKKPTDCIVIQRREYTRAEIEKNILLLDGNRNIRSTIKDISAGGMSIVTKEKLEKNKSYRADINLEKNIFISCAFKPIRIDLIEDSTYNVSGRFALIKNIDRVALVQFCLRKEQETKDKNK